MKKIIALSVFLIMVFSIAGQDPETIERAQVKR